MDYYTFLDRNFFFIFAIVVALCWTMRDVVELIINRCFPLPYEYDEAEEEETD